jgi:hypothetical protein
VTAINFNGEGPASPTARLRSCTLPRTGRGHFDAPRVVAVSATTISISWTGPTDDGGCVVLGYAIYVGQSQGVFVEYDRARVRHKPFLSSYDITMSSLSAVVGSTYLIKIGAENAIGEVQSDTVSVLLASVPETPPPPVAQLLNETHALIVMSPPASDGGDVVESYQLQLKLGDGEEGWRTILGENSSNLDLVYAEPIVSPGRLVWARYRCANEVGWSEFSDAN